VGRAATSDRGSASGLYLACYFFGGIVGSLVLGQIFDRFGWSACVAGIGLALAVAALLAQQLKMSAPRSVTATAS
jgi:MFS family permease